MNGSARMARPAKKRKSGVLELGPASVIWNRMGSNHRGAIRDALRMARPVRPQPAPYRTAGNKARLMAVPICTATAGSPNGSKELLIAGSF
jgi:hypothetical protein